MGEAGPAGLLNGSWWWANGNGIPIPSNAPALLSSDGLISTSEQLGDQIQGLVIAPSTHVLVDDPHPSACLVESRSTIDRARRQAAPPANSVAVEAVTGFNPLQHPLKITA